MGVTYKLKEEVVQFIINQKKDNSLLSCRQLAEGASQKFGLNLSKSSVHDVLKESGIITPRGRKPKNKFEIPKEKKKQIQATLTLSQVKLLPDPVVIKVTDTLNNKSVRHLYSEDLEISPEYEGAGQIFKKAILWDLGIFSQGSLKNTDWDYYLTYSKGIRVVLEDNREFFIDLPLPIERCIRETADGLINNVKPLRVHKVSDEELFKSCMAAQPGTKIKNISIVEQNNHILFEFSRIVDNKIEYILNNINIVESKERSVDERLKIIFFSQSTNNDIDNMLKLKGYDSTNKCENIVTILIEDSYGNKTILQQAAERLNGMFLYDDQNRLVKVKVQIVS